MQCACLQASHRIQDTCRFYVVPKKVQESFLLGELTKAPEKVQPRPAEDDFAVDDQDVSVVLDPVAHTEIVDPYADEDFFDAILVCASDVCFLPLLIDGVHDSTQRATKSSNE